MARRKRTREGSGELNYWQSYSDMMAALLLMFVLLITSTLLQSMSNLELSVESYNAQTEELKVAQSELEKQRDELIRLELELLAQQTLYSEKEGELTEAQAALLAQQTLLQEQSARLDEQNALLAERQEAFDEQSAALQIAQALLSEKQLELDKIVGVRSGLIKTLSDKFASTELKVKVDAQTGAITFDSSVLFDSGSSEIKESGLQFLREFVPIYLNVVLGEDYADYLSEIIIEGHTDSEGTYIYNLKLSQDRALAVANFILGGEIDLSRFNEDLLRDSLTANGKSYSSPILKADGTEDKSASRRVEIKFRLKDDEMIREMQEILGQSEMKPLEGTQVAGGSTARAEAVPPSAGTSAAAEAVPAE